MKLGEKKHFIPQTMAHRSRAQVRLYPSWPCCVCGRKLQAHDFTVDPDLIRLICGGCHTLFLEIEPE
jgi:hypothetical protein